MGTNAQRASANRVLYLSSHVGSCRVCSACVTLVLARFRSHQARRLQPFFAGMCMRLYVGNLSFNTEEPQLEQLFASMGQVDSVRLVRDQETGRSRGFAFIDMADETAGRAACEALDQTSFEGRRLTVNEARPQERRNGGPSKGGRRRDFNR